LSEQGNKMLSFRPLSVTDFPLLLTWLSHPHVKQWWNDGDDTLEKVAAHYGTQDPDVARFILVESTAAGEREIGYFQYYIVSQAVIGIDQFIGEPDRINQGVGTAAIQLFLEQVMTTHKLKQVILDPHPDNQRAIRCYEKVGFVYDPTLRTEDGSSAYMMRLDCKD
jgi:RimJ/RimL family protein N-acetyltransferase